MDVNPVVYGYGRLTLLKDELILMPYVHRHGVPQRCYMVRFKVNEARDGIKLLLIGK